MARKIHWLAPSTAVGSLTAGLLFMVGHHLFYKSIHNTPVSNGDVFGFEISQQQANIAIGTAFALLAKASLVVAVSVTTVQLFWHTILARGKNDVPTLERVDALHSVLDNAFEMFNVKSWISHPVLMLIAGLAWLVPIASILTPATISVETAQLLPAPITETRVPGLDFRNMNFLAPMPHTELPSAVGYSDPTPWFYSYAGPSDAVLRVANVVTVEGVIMPIFPPGTNASWHMDFDGPALECDQVDHDIATRFGDDFNAVLSEYRAPGDYGYIAWEHRQYGYIAWFPNGTARDKESIELPFLTNVSRNDTQSLQIGSFVPPPTYETLNRTTQSLEMMIWTKPFQLHSLLDYKNDDTDGLEMLKCRLYNRSYHVSFDYARGHQNITIDVVRDAPASPIQGIPGVLYKIQNQQTDYWEYPCRGEKSQELPCCYSNPNLLQTLSFQAIADAFTRKLQGSVFLDTTKDRISIGFHADSDFTQTTLASAKDTVFLATGQSPENVSHAATFQSETKAKRSSVTRGLNGSRIDFSGAYTEAEEKLPSELSLKDAIEEMFQNFTVSLMSSAALQPNYSSPTAPSPAAVTYHRYQNIYVYSPRNLWLPYGIALGLSSLAVITGLVTMFLNRASYSSNFTTVLRAAHGARLSTKMLDEDTHGEDPLPKYLADAKISLDGAVLAHGSERSPREPNVGRGHSKEARSTVRMLSDQESMRAGVHLRSQGRR